VYLGYSLLGTGDGASSLRTGLDFRQALTPSLNALATVNPDFSNVEQEVDRIDFSYNERALSDSRPFFQEGAGYFPSTNVFYPRRVSDIDVGAKLSGKTGQFDLAAMHIEEFGGENHSLIQFGRHFNNGGTRVWLGGVHSGLPGVDTSVGLLSWRHRVQEHNERQTIFSGAYCTSDSDLGFGRWYAMRLYTLAKPREIEYSIQREVVEPDFNPYMGIVTDRDRAGWAGSLSTWDEPSKGKISNWYTEMGFNRARHMNGSAFFDSFHAYGSLNFRNGMSLYVNAQQSARPPYHDKLIQTSYAWGGRELYKNGAVSVDFGKQAGGDYLYCGLGQGWKVSDKLSVSGQYGFARLKEPSPYAYESKQLVASALYDMSLERTVGGRLISGSGNTNLYMWFRQRVRAGLDAYLILGEPNADSTDSSLTLKLIRTL
jgi:hypothetical protein